METSIQIEGEKSKEYKLQIDQHHPELLALTIDNVARVEAILNIDSNYRKSSNKDAKPKPWKQANSLKGHVVYINGCQQYYEYGGSTAYWMMQLHSALLNKSHYLHDIMYNTISAVDRENSTHLTADKSELHPFKDGRHELTYKLFNHSSNLIEDMKDKQFDMSILSAKTSGPKGRENYSFATKFCHYACFYWFEGTPEADNYSIYDNVLAKTLVDYANTHGLHKILNGGVKFKESNFKNYEIYSQVIDVLRTKYGENISRNGFDHLLWYAYKGQ